MDRFFLTLPDVVLVEIINNLHCRDLISLGSVNYEMYQLIFERIVKTINFKSFKFADINTIKETTQYLNIEVLDFTGSDIEDDNLNQITSSTVSLPSLHSVCFNYCKYISEESMVTFFEKCNRMIYVGLAGCFISYKVLEVINKESLLVLDLDEIKTSGSRILSAISAANGLQHLSIGLIHESIIPSLKIMADLSKFQVFKNLESLTYGVTWREGQEDITYLLKLLSKTSLRELNLVNATVRLDMSATVRNYRSLRTCAFTYCSLTLIESFKKVNIKVVQKITSVPPINTFFGTYFKIDFV